MKRIEDIETMDEAQLERVALGEGIPVPEGLEGRIKAILAASELSGKTKDISNAASGLSGKAEEKASPVNTQTAPARDTRTLRRFAWPALAAAAATAALLELPRIGKAPLKDTFDDPYLAYAQVEEAFRTISDKMNSGLQLASEAGEAASKPFEIIDKINRK